MNARTFINKAGAIHVFSIHLKMDSKKEGDVFQVRKYYTDRPTPIVEMVDYDNYDEASEALDVIVKRYLDPNLKAYWRPLV